MTRDWVEQAARGGYDGRYRRQYPPADAMSKKPDNFTIDVGELEGVPVVTLRGVFRDKEGYDWAREELTRLLDGGTKTLVIHMGGVEKLASAGAMGTLVRAAVSAQRRGGNVRLAEVPESVMTILKIARIDTLFEIYPDSRSAVSGENRQ